MSAVRLLLSWFQPSTPVEDSLLQRLDGIKVHDQPMSEPRVRVFAERKRPVTAG
jgi:hypothetical protein